MGDCNCQDTELPELREKETFLLSVFTLSKTWKFQQRALNFVGF